ncbi:YezD family protein [Gorillibacterium massiliense]|uniref:YezD family protein n=1 Tax=Gorillibacterium massiliense TaxID=1280390 RepID=UPI0004AE1141|nr:YezD family protein [Gorillibacterium massiliense]
MAKPLELDEKTASLLTDTLNGMLYGTVQIVVHEGRIVQIDKTDRKRFDPSGDELSNKRREAR